MADPRPLDPRRDRLDLAGTRTFTEPGAGPRRRASITEYTRSWLTTVWSGTGAASSAGAASPVGVAPRAGAAPSAGAVPPTGVSSPAGVALAAVGSLGRGDGGPLSDLDLVLLHNGRSLSATELTVLADRIWYPLWDAGVALDHSVRTPAQCRAVAGADLVAAVGLLDLTHIAGDRELVTATRATIGHDWRSGARLRLPELIDAVGERHTRHGEVAQSVEPELKEAHGGLRDMVVLRALVAAWLTDRSHGRVDEAYERLLDVRDAHHVVTGRGRDRLIREEQDAVAALLGHRHADDLLTSVSGSARVIGYALDGAIRRSRQSQRARVLRVGPRRPVLRSLGYGVFEHDGEAVLGTSVGEAVRGAAAGKAVPGTTAAQATTADGEPRSPTTTRLDALRPLRTAAVAARSALPLAPRTLANLADAPPLLTPWPPLARELLTDLLVAGPGLVPVWEGLSQVGLIVRWFPEWEAIDSRPQRNPVHRHTVDRHLIETVIEASALIREVSRPDLLLLAALLHDIGKVEGALDHSVTGAKIAAGLLARIGLPAADAATVVLLVREHLTLIQLATTRDLGDPATVAAAWAAAGSDLATFELLRALTIADARAAGPLAWTTWRANLLDALIIAVRRAPSTAGLSSPVTTDGGVPKAGPSSPSTPDSDLLAFGLWSPPTPDSDTDADDLVDDGAHVMVTPTEGGYRLDIRGGDRLGLFADTAGLLAAHGLTVRSAELRTRGAVATNRWQVESPSGDPPDAERLIQALTRLDRGDRSPLQPLERRRRFARSPGQRSEPGRHTRAFVVPDAATEATVIEVRADDRLGLLHDLGATFAAAGLSIRSAHIATHARQTLDTFYVTESPGRPLAPAKVAAILAALIDTCDGSTDVHQAPRTGDRGGKTPVAGETPVPR